MKLTEYLKNNIVYLDGGMGTLLQAKDLVPGELPEGWNLTHSDIICDIHRQYYDAGSNIVSTNTFGANALKYSADKLEEIVKAAVENARKAATASCGTQEKWVALDIGPSGRLLAPYGDFDFEDAVEMFAKTVRLGVKYGVDLIFIETMNDSYETKAALLAAKENCDLPVFVSNAYSEDGKLITGADPAAMVAMLEGLGADAIGVNCSFGPKTLAPVISEYLRLASVPVLVKPNAGLPCDKDGCTHYDVLPDEFAMDVTSFLQEGASIAGGCCGTTPEYISALTKASRNVTRKPIEKKNITWVSSYTHAVTFGQKPVLIGERINPTGKKRFKEALRAKDMDYILKEGVSQQEKGVDILDVNVGLPEIDEKAMLTSAVTNLQAIIDLPLQIDTSDISAMESALRRYNGKAMINSVNGKQESMDAVFPLAKKYGGVVVALTLDENGIPSTAEKRLNIAKKILKTAEEYGIGKENIIFDPLALTVSADDTAGRETLRAVEMITKDLGCHTSLGVSNVSFGLPKRDIINSTFFTLAMGNGLSAAILNPNSVDMMKSYYAYCALCGLDSNCQTYISFAETLPDKVAEKAVLPSVSPNEYKSELQRAIIKGFKDEAATLTKALLESTEPLKLVEEEIVPALNQVGVGFEKKTVYLPQLLMSAEAAQASFEQIKARMTGTKTVSKGAIVVATVKGDIHDIGKNIVKLLLENFGFEVRDLGKDVPPSEVLSAVRETGAKIVALSALMTTTVPAMEETVKLIHSEIPDCRVIVGGAVLNREYAEKIGADSYGKDAMEAVRCAERFC